METVGIHGNNGQLQLINYFFSADADGKTVLVTVDVADQKNGVRHPKLSLVRLVGIKEVGEIELPFCVMRRSRGVQGDLPGDVPGGFGAVAAVAGGTAALLLVFLFLS